MNTPNNISMMEKYEKYTLDTASLRLVFSFLLRRLNYLSKQQNIDTKIISWALDTLNTVTNTRSTINQCIENTTLNHHQSGASTVLGCKMPTTFMNHGLFYSYWFAGRHYVKSSEGNPLQIGSATIKEILDQICHRFEEILGYLKKGTKCDYDFSVIEIMEKALEVFDNLYDQFNNFDFSITKKNNTQDEPSTPSTKNENKMPGAPRKPFYKTNRKNNLTPKKLFDDAPTINEKSTSYANVVKGTLDDKILDKPMNESVNKPMDESMNKPMGESVNKPMDESMNKPMGESVNKPMDESVNKLVDELTNNKSIGEPIESTSSITSNQISLPINIVPLQVDSIKMVKIPMLMIGSDGKATITQVLINKLDLDKISMIDASDL